MSLFGAIEMDAFLGSFDASAGDCDRRNHGRLRGSMGGRSTRSGRGTRSAASGDLRRADRWRRSHRSEQSEAARTEDRADLRGGSPGGSAGVCVSGPGVCVVPHPGYPTVRRRIGVGARRRRNALPSNTDPLRAAAKPALEATWCLHGVGTGAPRVPRNRLRNRRNPRLRDLVLRRRCDPRALPCAVRSGTSRTVARGVRQDCSVAHRLAIPCHHPRCGHRAVGRRMRRTVKCRSSRIRPATPL